MSSRSETAAAGWVLVVSGASGSGKSSICARLLARRPERYLLSISATTRPRRGTEADGVDYHFVSEEEFDAMAQGGELLEHAEVFGRRYGTPRRNLDEAIAERRVLLLDIDVQGGRRLREAGVPGLFVWVEAPSPEELERRLRRRGTDSGAEIAGRLAAAADERRAAAGVYDRFVTNDDLDRVVTEIDGQVAESLPVGG